MPTGRSARELDDLLGPDPVIEAYERHVDRALLRESRKRSVEERLVSLVARQRPSMEARRAGRELSRRSSRET
ncbi:MAG TPA: hypothetical protein VFS08_20735 [Gemmatimonadaceae bacterium]|nr:hypothetical protein [Gemmatimonadaceae bacterium]